MPALKAVFTGDAAAYAGHYGARPLARTVADNIDQVQRLLSGATLVASDSASIGVSGRLTPAAPQQVLLVTAMQTAERGDYGVGAEGMARFQLPALIAAARAAPRPDSAGCRQ